MLKRPERDIAMGYALRGVVSCGMPWAEEVFAKSPISRIITRPVAAPFAFQTISRVQSSGLGAGQAAEWRMDKFSKLEGFRLDPGNDPIAEPAPMMQNSA